MIEVSPTQLTLIPQYQHCSLQNHHDYCVGNEPSGARVDVWQLGMMLAAVVRVKDDSGLVKAVAMGVVQTGFIEDTCFPVRT